MSSVYRSPGLTEAQSAGAGLTAAALAARDPAALVCWRGGGRRCGSRDAAVAAVAKQLAWGAGATTSCREREARRRQKTCTMVRQYSKWLRHWLGKGSGTTFNNMLGLSQISKHKSCVNKPNAVGTEQQRKS